VLQLAGYYLTAHGLASKVAQFAMETFQWAFSKQVFFDGFFFIILDSSEYSWE
jgi:hypothetical protein